MSLHSCNGIVFVFGVLIAILLVLKAVLYSVRRCKLSDCTFTPYIHQGKYNMTIALGSIIPVD